jgi:hypothetical protein
VVETWKEEWWGTSRSAGGELSWIILQITQQLVVGRRADALDLPLQAIVEAVHVKSSRA